MLMSYSMPIAYSQAACLPVIHRQCLHSVSCFRLSIADNQTTIDFLNIYE
ncbi:MAG: hypothetical protein RSB82_02480 [Victivallaceae bacterium]